MKKWKDDFTRERLFPTVSDLDIKPIYTPEDINGLDFEKDISYPGIYPFTRGCQPTGYRGRAWTFQMFAGFGSAGDTNKRWHQLLKDGETGLSTAFDFPTLMGYDSKWYAKRIYCSKDLDVPS